MKRMEKCVKIEYLLQGLMRGILCAIATWTFAQQVEKCVTKLRKSPFCCGKMRKMSIYFRWGMVVEEFRIAQSKILATQHHFVATTEKVSRGYLCNVVLIDEELIM